MDPAIINIYNNDNFPCFVKNGEDIEDLNTTSDVNEKYARIARNGLRHLTYGTSLVASKLLTLDNFKALCIKRDPHLFDALRKEMQNIFLNVSDCLANKQLNPDAEKRVEIFINNLLCAYPFMDPKVNKTIILPQKNNNEWQKVKYRVEKIDISPQTGLLSKLIEDEDRLYAYGLVPTSLRDAQPYLLLEGTTYPSGQGADLNYLYNFKPNTSVGEAHDTTLLERWIKRQRNIKVAGHSKGGTMAMIIASKYAEWISQADCLNPTALCKATINRLAENWSRIPEAKKPRINVYTQAGDPIFLIETSFLEFTHIFRIGKETDHNGKLEAHAHYFLGRKTALIEEIVDLQQEIRSKKREFISDLKEALNWAMFPLLYMKLCYKLCMRKIERFCDKYSTPLHIALFIGGLVGCAALITSGVGAPVALPLIAKIGAPLAYVTISLCSIAASAITSVVAPKLAKFGVNLTSSIAFTGASIGTFLTTVTLGALFSGIKIGIKSLFQRTPTPPDIACPVGNKQQLLFKSK